MLTNIINVETPDNKPPNRTTVSNDNVIPIAITTTPIMNTTKNLAILSDIVINYYSIYDLYFILNSRKVEVHSELNLKKKKRIGKFLCLNN